MVSQSLKLLLWFTGKIPGLLRNYPVKFGLKLLRVTPRLRGGLAKQRATPPEIDAKAVFQSCAFDDLWEDAKLPQCLEYLKGNINLQIPEAWRPFLPREL